MSRIVIGFGIIDAHSDAIDPLAGSRSVAVPPGTACALACMIGHIPHRPERLMSSVEEKQSG